MIIKKHQPPFRNFEQVAFFSIGSHDFQEWTATYQWSLTIHFFLLTLWFFNSSLWKPGPIKKSMMKMMIYRTYPLVNYTIDPEHQHFFVETNLPTHQLRRLLRNPRISMEALPAGFMDDFPLLCWAMPEGQRNSFDWSNHHWRLYGSCFHFIHNVVFTQW